MSLVSYTSLYPTGDAVEYDSSAVEYPASNVVDTFGQIWVSKVHGFEMTALEVASSGKIAFTPSNEHSLDLRLDKAQGSVELRARNGNALVAGNEASTALLTLADDGSASLSAAGGDALLQMDAGGSGDSRYVVPTARAHRFAVGTADVLAVEEGGASVSNLTVDGTEFRVPVGAQGDRPTGTEGQIFYNATSSRFEGYASGAWSGLGGTVDVDQDTYVSAETSPNADNDQLLFVTAGVERLRIDAGGRVGYGTEDPQFDLDWRGDAEIATGDGNVLRVDGSGVFVGAASGSNLFSVQAGQDHAFDVGEDRIAAIDGSGLSASNLTVNGTSFLVPRGPQDSRPAGTDGQIFYNEDTGRFEGYASSAWGGLGGTVDVDQNTYVSAEDSPGDDNNELKFVTDGEERMRITDAGLLGYGTSNPEYTLDIVGDLRVSGSILAATSVIGEANGNRLDLGVQADGSKSVVDALDTNDGSGLRVVGVPKATLFSSTREERFEKSLTWHFNQTGMQDLGKADAWETESFWKLRGGALRLSHTNADSGAEVEVIMRINEKDELQVVRHTVPANGDLESYEVIARFGNKTGATRMSGERGHATLDADRTSMADGTVSAFIDAFSAYDDYVVRGALYPLSASPTVSEVVAASATENGYLSDTLSAGADVSVAATFTAMHDGGAIPDELLKFAAVIELADGTLSAAPHVSFVINDASVYTDLVLAADQETQSVVNYDLRFTSLSWDELSAADKAVFEEWLEGQVLQTLQAQGSDVQSVDFTFESGSIIADVNVTVPTSKLTKTLNNATSAVSTSVISTASTTPIQFVDRPAETVSAGSVTKNVKAVTRIQSAPLVVSVSQGASTDTALPVTYEVSEANPSFAVTKLYALATTAPLAEPVLPSKVVANGEVQSFSVSGTRGTVDVAMDTSIKNYLYFVAENNVTPTPVRSHVLSATTSLPTTVIMPNSVAISQSSGLYQIAEQDGADAAVAIKSGMVAYSSASSATASLLLYKQGDVDVPATASAAKAQLDGAASAVTASLL